VAKDPGQNHQTANQQPTAQAKAGVQTANAIASQVTAQHEASQAATQAFLGVASAPAKPAGGDTFIKPESMEPKVVAWTSRSSDAFAAERVGDPNISIDAKTAAQQDAPAEEVATETAAEGEKTEATEAADDKADTETKAEDAKEGAKVEAKTEDKADEKNTTEAEKKDEPVKPKVPKPNGSETRKDTMRALRLEGELRQERAEKQALKAALAAKEASLKTAPLDERLGHLGLTREELTEYALTGALPDPKTPVEKPAETETAKPSKLEEEVASIKQQLLASQQRETVALAMADIGGMDVPLVKGTAGAMQAIINEAAVYYNKTGGKIEGADVPFRDYVQSFALHKEAELKEAAPKVLEQVEAHAANLRKLLGIAATEATKPEVITPGAKPTNGTDGPRAPIGKKLAARSTTSSDDKYSMDPLQRDLEIKKELGWGS
jgi:hypothetical protein